LEKCEEMIVSKENDLERINSEDFEEKITNG